MSLESVFVTPEMASTLLNLKFFFVLIVCMGAVGIAIWMSSVMSLSGSIGPTLAFIGLALVIAGGVPALGCDYAINYIDNHRPTELTSAYTFTDSKYQPIASLKDNAITNGINIHGSFFLGIGSVSGSGGNSVPVYVFYKRMPDNEYIQDTLPSANTYIKEDGDSDPKIEWIYTHSVAAKKTYLDNGAIIGGEESVALTKTVIHVPANTIKVDYDLDSSYGGVVV